MLPKLNRICFLFAAAFASLVVVVVLSVFSFLSAKQEQTPDYEIEVIVDAIVRMKEKVPSDWAQRSFSTSGGSCRVKFRRQQNGVEVEIYSGDETKAETLLLDRLPQIECGNVRCVVRESREKVSSRE
jgi:hypothetical protein